MFRQLIAFIVIGQACNGALVALNGSNDARLTPLFTFGVLWLAAEFCAREFENAGHRGLMDTGLLFGWTWPITLPYVLLRYGGFNRGARRAGGLSLAFVLPYALAWALMRVVLIVMRDL
jgi:hypothetical protein